MGSSRSEAADPRRGTDGVLALVGPTASGKTAASVAIAEALGAEILCVDSMLVYRGMDVGTAKPTVQDRRRVPHHLLDLVDPQEPFSVSRFQAAAHAALSGIRARGAPPLLVGGSGLYFRAVADGFDFPGTDPRVRALLEAEAVVLGPEQLYRRLVAVDPQAADRMQPRNVRRIVRALEVAAITGRPFSAGSRGWGSFPSGAVTVAGVDLPREFLHRRIEARTWRIMPGLLRETEALLSRGFERFLTSTQAIGYPEAVDCLRGIRSAESATEETIRRTKGLARRQLSWFRRDPRVRWFAAGEEGAPGIADELTAFFGRARQTVEA